MLDFMHSNTFDRSATMQTPPSKARVLAGGNAGKYSLLSRRVLQERLCASMSTVSDDRTLRSESSCSSSATIDCRQEILQDNASLSIKVFEASELPATPFWPRYDPNCGDDVTVPSIAAPITADLIYSCSPAGDISSRYSFDGSVLGKGAFGTVERATDLLTGETVAIKRVNSDQPYSVQGAELEARALRRLQSSPNVIGFRDYMHQASSRTHMIVMEAAMGGDLYSHVMECRRPLSEEESRTLFSQMLRGVEQMHARGVAHRDLKLENAVLDDRGEVRWIDFGLAHVFPRCAYGHDEYEVTPLTEPVGSRPYMAPEVAELYQHRDAAAYDAFAADVWALGVCLFGMLHAFFPVSCADESEPAFAVLCAAQRAGLSGVHALCAHYGRECTLSPAAAALIDCLLSVDPLRRPSAHAARHCDWLVYGAPRALSPLALPPVLNANETQRALYVPMPLAPMPRFNMPATSLARKRTRTGAATHHTHLQTQQQPHHAHLVPSARFHHDLAYQRQPLPIKRQRRDGSHNEPFAFSLLDACQLFAETGVPAA